MSNLPRGKIGRFARLAALGLKTGAGAILGRDDDTTRGQATALSAEAARVLGNLRGLAAKVGQMASYVDGIVPEAQRDAYEASLRVLRAQAPCSPPESIRALVENELGAPIDHLFSEWNDEPIASASIGQVHRALTSAGEAVAVKVQHAGIREAVESDLASAGLLEMVIGAAGGKKFDAKALFDVVRTRFREELDYDLEASRLTAFGKLHDGDPTVRVPALFPALSSKSVLTTAFVEGQSFEEAIVLPESERRAYAETLWRFVFKGNLVGGMFNADPHPGNYIFHGEGRVTFLDYGCVQVIPDRNRPHSRAIHRAAIARDEVAFKNAFGRLLGTKPGTLEGHALGFTRQCFEPLFGSPFRVTRPFAASLVEDFKAMTIAARKAKGDEFFTMPPEMLFMNRLQFGFYSVLARFDVEMDYAEIERAFLPSD